VTTLLPLQQSNHGCPIKQNCYKLIEGLLSFFFHTAFALGIFLNSYNFGTHVYVSHAELLRSAVKCILARSVLYFSWCQYIMSVWKRGVSCLIVQSVVTHCCYLTHKSHGPYDRYIRSILEGTTSRLRTFLSASDHDREFEHHTTTGLIATCSTPADAPLPVTH